MTHSRQALACLIALIVLGSGNIAAANICVWTGAINGLWSAPGNWSGCAGTPVNGDTLHFPEAANNKNMTHELAPLNSVAAINFTGTTSGYTLSGNGLSIGDGGISNGNATGSNQIDLDLTLGASQSFAGGSGAMLISNTVDLNGQTVKITWPLGSGLLAWTISGVVSGNGAIEVTGFGLSTGLQLSGDNSFGGPLTLKSGSTLLGHAHALGVADGSVGNGTNIHSGAGLMIGTNLTIGNESLSMASGAGQDGRGQLRFLGGTFWGGPVQLFGIGTSRIASSSAGSSLQFAGEISGTGGLELGSNPNVSIKLSNAGNSFSGGVTTMALTPTQGVVIQLGANFALPGSSSVVLNGHSLLDLNAFDASIPALACTSTDSLAFGFGSSLTVGSNNASTNCDAQISGNPSTSPITVLTKVGSGVLTLSGESTYAGEVDVLGGGLQVNGGLMADPSTAIFVSSGQNATLFGNGAVGNVVASGIVHGGGSNTPGTLSTSFLSLVGIGRISARLAGAADYDQLIASNVSLGASSALLLSLDFDPIPGTVFTLINNIGGLAVTGTFAGLPEGASVILAGTPLQISYVGGNGNDVTLTVLANLPLLNDGFE